MKLRIFVVLNCLIMTCWVPAALAEQSLTEKTRLGQRERTAVGNQTRH